MFIILQKKIYKKPHKGGHKNWLISINFAYFQEETKDLVDFLNRQHVDPMLTVKTLKYFEYVWKRTHGSNPQVREFFIKFVTLKFDEDIFTF